MPDMLRKIEFYTLVIPDKPGEGAKVLEAFREVNLLGLWGYPIAGRKAALEMLPQDVVAFKAAAKKAKIAVGAKKTGFLLTGEDRPGALLEIARKLAQAGVNLWAIKAVSAGCGYFGSAFFVDQKDVRKAAKALGI